MNVSETIGETNVFIRRGMAYSNQSVSTGDDYPHWWVQLPTNVLLSNRITNQGEKKAPSLPTPSPGQQLDQSIQTEIEENFETKNEQPRPQSASTHSSQMQKSTSSIAMHESYEIIDQDNDGNNSRRLLPFQGPVQRVNERKDCSLSKRCSL